MNAQTNIFSISVNTFLINFYTKQFNITNSLNLNNILHPKLFTLIAKLMISSNPHSKILIQQNIRRFKIKSNSMFSRKYQILIIFSSIFQICVLLFDFIHVAAIIASVLLRKQFILFLFTGLKIYRKYFTKVCLKCVKQM